MSRAFVKETDLESDDVPERSISSAANWVTEAGLAAIEAEIAELAQRLSEAGDDADARGRIARELRYWTARRGSARVVHSPPSADIVRFGSTVTIEREDGRRDTYRIVGEDEADPASGTVSHVSPIAAVLLGKGVGDILSLNGSDIEIVAIG